MKRIARQCSMYGALMLLASVPAAWGDDTEALRNMVERLSTEKRELAARVTALQATADESSKRVRDADARLTNLRRAVDAAEKRLVAQEADQAAAVEKTVARLHATLVAELAAAKRTAEQYQAVNEKLLVQVGIGTPLPIPGDLHVGSRLDGGRTVRVVSVVDGRSALIDVGTAAKPKIFCLQNIDTDVMVDDQKYRIPNGLEIVGNFSYARADDRQSTIWAVRQLPPTTQP